MSSSLSLSMNASSTDIVASLEQLGFILIAGLVSGQRFSGVWGFRRCGIKCSTQQFPVSSCNARDCSELADSVRGQVVSKLGFDHEECIPRPDVACIF